MDPDEIIAYLEGALAAQTARADNAEAQVEELHNQIRNSPLNVVRDHPELAAVVAASFVLTVGILILVLRNIDFTVTAWCMLLGAAVATVGFVSYVVLARWRAQHQLDHPAP